MLTAAQVIEARHSMPGRRLNHWANEVVPRERKLRCSILAWDGIFAHDCALATRSYVWETVRGAARRLKKDLELCLSMRL